MPHHIVIVEDEPVTQARLQSYFTQEGYTVSVTASGAGLREIMQNQATATFFPVEGAIAGEVTRLFAHSQSATKRSRRPMLTDFSAFL